MPEYTPSITAYEYVGDVNALGSLQLTELARSFEQLGSGELDDIFPDKTITERTVVIEQVIEGLGLMPVVRPATASGAFIEPDRVRRFTSEPLYVRDNDFIDQFYVNQLRRVGTMNEAYAPQQHVADRVAKAVARHRRTMDFYRAQTLLGGASYTDPATGVPVNYSTNIPAHNLFTYNGFNATVSAGGNVVVAGETLVADSDLVNDKGRTEASLFQSTDDRVGVKWTDPKADISKSINLIKQFLFRTNKNRFTEIVMSSDLLTVLMENELIKQAMNKPAILIDGSSKAAAVPGTTGAVPGISIGAGGELAAIGGLRIRLVDGIYRDPATSEIKTYWPAHKVAIIAPTSFQDASTTLGYTYHPVGEAPDGQPGYFVRTADHLTAAPPPAPPGMTMQFGDAFLPVAVYPHWISVLDVAEEADLVSSIILQSNLGFGTF